MWGEGVSRGAVDMLCYAMICVGRGGKQEEPEIGRRLLVRRSGLCRAADGGQGETKARPRRYQGVTGRAGVGVVGWVGG